MAGDGIVVALLPVGMVPERQRHRPETRSAEPIVAAESRRVHFRAKIDEAVDEVCLAGFNREVQGSPAEMVAAVHQVGFPREKFLDGVGVASGDGVMDGVPAAGGGDTTSQLVAQEICNFVGASVEGHLQQGLLCVQRTVEDIRTGIQQHARGVQMSLSHCEVQGWRVPELPLDQGRIVFEHRAEPGGVPVASGVQHLPDRLAKPVSGPIRFVGNKLEGSYESRPGHEISVSG